MSVATKTHSFFFVVERIMDDKLYGPAMFYHRMDFEGRVQPGSCKIAHFLEIREMKIVSI